MRWSFVVLTACGRLDFASSAIQTDAGAIDAPIDANTVACDPFMQTGCPATYGCYYNQDATATTCIVAGTVATAGPCTDTSQCVPGDSCTLIADNAGGTCTPDCRNATDCTNGKCLDVKLATVGVCELACDPVVNTGCAEACYLVAAPIFPDETDQGGSTTCGPSRGNGLGVACSNATDCAPQSTCAQNVCRPLCYFSGGGPACTAGLVCTSFTPAIKRGAIEFGVCVSG
ncbi:MAG: hypothetical protein QM831_12915 [Kofleriaceae bacterium]